jgi:hypothetical protein
MEINKRVFSNAVSQIKAYKDVVVLQDSAIDGCLDILYAPKTSDHPHCINKMTICVGGQGIDLFDDTPTEKLGSSLLVHLTRVKGILKEATTCIIENGNLNGIRVEVDSDDMAHSVLKYLTAIYADFSKRTDNSVDITIRQIDYSYMVTELSKFVSKDLTRYFMNGICFDFDKSEDNSVNFIATDGRKMSRMKYNLNGQKKGSGEYVILPEYLFVPHSYFSSAQMGFTEKYSRLMIHTEDYNFESWFSNCEGTYPNYPKVIPEITGKTEWFTLCAASFRMTIDSVKSLMGKRDMIYLNAENPENLTITVAEGTTTLEVEGTASRPMLVSCLWEHLGACLFDGVALTKFYLDGSNCAIHAHENKAVKGITMNVTKLFMPTQDDNHKDDDEFRIPKKKPTTEVTTETPAEETAGEIF